MTELIPVELASYTSAASTLERLVWQADRMLLDDLVFRIEHARNDNWDLGDDCFLFYKTKYLVDQYAEFLATRQSFRPDNVLELGIWDGGSVAFWFECLQPTKHVGVDLAERGDSAYFRRYVSSRGLEHAIVTHWGVDQADAENLRALVTREFSAPLDLVIDDASHLYGPTRASFEVLFPLLRPGGVYVIEDWAWEHWTEFQSPDHPWADQPSLTMFVNQLVAATGGISQVIANISVFQGFVAVERGQIESASLEPFSVDRFVSYRPVQSRLKRVMQDALGRLRH